MTDSKRKTITIPRDIKTVAGRIAAIDAVITAKQWEKAALITAFTAPGQFSFEQLANEAGISVETIKKYRRVWLSSGKTKIVIKPGSKVSIPDTPWPGVSGGRRKPASDRQPSIHMQLMALMRDIKRLRDTLSSTTLTSSERSALRKELKPLEETYREVQELLAEDSVFSRFMKS